MIESIVGIEAVEALKQALDIAMPDEIYMPFVENGGYLMPLLDRSCAARENTPWA